MSVLVLDNYDSFTYNLVQMLRECGLTELEVKRNDKISVEAVAQYDKIILSPGPGIPDEAGILKALIQEYAKTKPILGVCLGHQAIAEVFGAEIYNMPQVYHGIADEVIVQSEDYLFKDIPKQFKAGRYHSWSVQANSLVDELEVTATDSNGEIMAMRHKEYNVRGVQFHPESILTEFGHQMIKNFIEN